MSPVKSLNSVAVALAATAVLGTLAAVAPHAPTAVVAAQNAGTGDTDDSGWGGRIANGVIAVTGTVFTTDGADGSGA
ncbi:hypothetical protein [Streptomyces adustus]